MVSLASSIASLDVAHLHHRDHRAEGLLAHHLHRVVDVGDHGRLVPVAGAVLALAAGEDAGAGLARVLDLVGDDLDLRRRGHRADLGRVGVAVGALAQGLDLLRELGDELVVDRLLDVDALDRDADLAAC